MKLSLKNERSKISALLLTLAVAVFLTFYFHQILGEGIIFTHFFYIPIILATLWWKRKGLIIPIALALILVASHYISGVNYPLYDDLFRSLMFLIIGVVVAILSEEISANQQKLKESEKKFASVAKTAVDGILTTDHLGKIVFVNDSLLKIFGYQKEEIIEKEIRELIPHRINIKEILKTAQSTTNNRFLGRTLESFGLRKDGTEFPVEASVSTWIFDDHKYFTGIIRDITQRKIMEKKKNELAAIVESTDDAIIGRNLDGIITSWNQGAEDIYGYSEEETLGKDMAILIPPGYEDEFPKLMEEHIIKGKRVRHYESQRKRKDGKIIDISLTISPTLNEDGEVIGSSSIARDITAQKMNQKELKERQIYQKTIFRAIQTGIIVLDAETKTIVDVNDVAADLIGTSKDQIIGKVCHKFLCPAEEDKCPIIDLNQKVDNSQRILLNIHGEGIPVIKNVVKIKLNGKEHLLESFVDITERLKAEEQIKQSLKDKDMLIGEIHHRVKNNLIIITSLLSLQSDYVKDQESRSLFEESENRARSMALIHEKLYQSGEAKRIDFEEYIQSLGKELYQTYALNNRLDMQMDLQKDLILDVDTAIPLGLIFNELFTNSLKHAFPEGGEGTIKVGFHKLNDKYQLIVEDNGVGLSEDFKMEESDSFGLRLVDALTQQIDAQVELDTNHGTRYTITFQEEAV
jgi:PAS domain S-box-containing protein